MAIENKDLEKMVYLTNIHHDGQKRQEFIDRINQFDASPMDKIMGLFLHMKLEGYDGWLAHEMKQIGNANGIHVEEIDNPDHASDWDWFTMEIADEKYTVSL